jgi:hypothetical protein
LQSEDLVVTVERFSAATNRINLAMIGDGYQVDELESRYQSTVRDSLDYFFTHPKADPTRDIEPFLMCLGSTSSLVTLLRL